MLRRNPDSNHQLSPSASKATPGEESSPVPKNFNPRKRDIGYGTEFSPFSTASTPRRFTFDSEAEEAVFDLSQELQAVDLSEEAFPFETEESHERYFNNDADDTDKEVEEILNESGELGTSMAVSQRIEISPKRPTAPVPTPNDLHYEHYSPVDVDADNSSGFSECSVPQDYNVKPKRRAGQY